MKNIMADILAFLCIPVTIVAFIAIVELIK